MAYEQPAAQPAPEPKGLDVQALIRQFGPLAAVAAAIPAIVLARGAGGQKMYEIIRRYAPKHLNQLERSPMTYELSQDAASPMLNVKGLNTKLNPMTGHIQSSAVTDVFPLESSTMHEFGHATGFERARQQFPNGAPRDLMNYGGWHMDKMLEPKTQRIIADEFTKNPMSKLYTMYRMGDQGVFGGLGEGLTELWGNRMLRNGGYRGPLFDPLKAGLDKARIPDYESMYKAPITSLQQSGRLPGAEENQLRQRIQEYLTSLQRLRPQ